jgi:Na+-translocating ferredoxin:NAD+ oxidoreductase RnfG subunit
MGKPVVGLGTWELAKRGGRVEAFTEATTPEDAVTTAMAAAELERTS